MSRAAAIFDVDHTLLPGASLESLFIRYLLRTGRLGLQDAARSLGFLASRAGRIPLRRVVKENKTYLAGRAAEPFTALCREWIAASIVARIADDGIRAIEVHRAEGALLILLTGALDTLANPLGEHLKADIVLATRLASEDGRLTGALIPPHPYGEGKWAALEPVASARAIDLSRSHAYADSPADMSILERVGHPHVVSPGRRMRTIARTRGWDIRRWVAPVPNDE